MTDIRTIVREPLTGHTFRLHLQATFDDDVTSDWLHAGYWGDVETLSTNREPPRFERGVVEMDWLKLTTKATGFRFRVVCAGAAELKSPPSLTIIATDTSPSSRMAERYGSEAPTEDPDPRVLDLPLLAQDSLWRVGAHLRQLTKRVQGSII